MLRRTLGVWLPLIRKVAGEILGQQASVHAIHGQVGSIPAVALHAHIQL